MSKPQTSAEQRGRVRGQAEGALFWLTFENEARMNALNEEMWAALPGLIGEAEADDDVRVVILRGAGSKAFSAGADISEFGTQRTGKAAKAYDRLNQAAFDALANCSKPTLAMISGFCMGGGLELALCCDLRLANEDAQFAIPAAKLGIGYNPRWFRPLLAVVQAAKLKDLIYTGRRLDAREALAIGMVNEVCEAEEFEARTLAMAQTIAANAPLSIRAAKQAIDAHAQALNSEQLAELDALVEACFDSDDYREGQAAFAEKRPPRFRGR